MLTATLAPIRSRGYLALLGLTLLLSSCSSIDRLPEPSAIRYSPAQLARLNHLNDWNLSGKVGIRTPDEAASVIINWSQHGSRFDIFLSGPLGQGSTRIQGDDGSVSMQRSGEEPLRAASPEELLYESLGWRLPISELQYWVRGIAAPDSPVTQHQFNRDGTSLQLQQRGWTIDYSRYQLQQQLPLPSRLIITRGPLKLTFILKKWQLNP